MEGEYQFNYDQLKQIFESVPATTTAAKQSRTVGYKSRFQPRSKSSTTLSDQAHVDPYASLKGKAEQASSKVLVKVQCLRVRPLMPIERFSLQTQQGFYLMSTDSR